MTGTRFQVHAMRIAVVALGEDHAVERTIEFDVDAHVRLLALHLQMLDLRAVVRSAQRPLFVGANFVAVTTAARGAAAAMRLQSVGHSVYG